MMGEISRRLHRKLTKLVPPGDITRPPMGWRPQTPAPDIPKMIAKGYDPVHAAYIFVHHITSVFSENVSRLPEMRTYAQEVGSAEEEYMPSGPPMSPLTTSFFSCWAFLDHRIGKTTDTLAGCLIEANDSICMKSDQLEALRRMSQSRMGIYEHQGLAGELCAAAGTVHRPGVRLPQRLGLPRQEGRTLVRSAPAAIGPQVCHLPRCVHYALRTARFDEEGLDRLS